MAVDFVEAFAAWSAMTEYMLGGNMKEMPTADSAFGRIYTSLTHIVMRHLEETEQVDRELAEAYQRSRERKDKDNGPQWRQG